MPARRLVPLGLLLVLLAPLAPQAAGHGGETHGTAQPDPAHDVPEEPPREAMLRGYTGPGREPYLNYFEGAWIFGRFTATPLPNQTPLGLTGSGDWLVWEDAASRDIFAYSVPAGTGFYLNRDLNAQRAPAIDGNVVVWEETRSGRATSIYAYFLDTGETRLVSKTPGNNRNPSVRDGLIAWENDGDRNFDIWAYDVENGTEFPIATGKDRQSDPLVLDGKVYYREYRFNIWDLFAVDAFTGERTQVTSDTAMEAAPFTNGEDVFFQKQYSRAWKLHKHSPGEERTVETPLSFQDSSPTPVSGDRLLYAARDLTFRQLVARNVTSGESLHVTGDLVLTTEPWLDGTVAYVPVLTASGTSLLQIEVSPFAWVEKPEIKLLSPRSGARWGGPVTVVGVFVKPAEWAEPATFTYRVDEDPPVALSPEGQFRFVLDPSDREAGRHQVVLRATFREGPPVEANVLLLVPDATQRSVDVEALGQSYHDQRITGVMRQYLYDNPASVPLLALVLLLLVVIAVRVWVTWRPMRRRRVVAEYVPPE